MAKGLSGVGEFTALLTADQRRLAERLAEIEREDADRLSLIHISSVLLVSCSSIFFSHSTL